MRTNIAMKKNIYILAIFALLIPGLYGQEEIDKPAVNRKAQDTTVELSPATNKQDTTSESAPATDKQDTTVEPNPIKESPTSENSVSTTKGNRFGSKEHRKSMDFTDKKSINSNNLLLKTCLSLAAVIGLILLIFSALKKFNKRYLNAGSENPMRVCNRTVLDGKNYLTLVRVYEEELLLSVGPNGANLVARYALIDKDTKDFDSLVNEAGGNRIPIDSKTHISSIDLGPVKDKNNEA